MDFFAYGTLRPGGELYGQIQEVVLDECGATIEGRLFVLSEGYPILVLAEPGYPITGRLLTLPDSPVTLERLDRIEGVRLPNSPYIRVQRRIVTDRGDTMAWMYICKSEQAGWVLNAASELVQGDWLGRGTGS